MFSSEANRLNWKYRTLNVGFCAVMEHWRLDRKNVKFLNVKLTSALANLSVSCCSDTDLPACSLLWSGPRFIRPFHTRDMTWIQKTDPEAASGILLEKVRQPRCLSVVRRETKSVMSTLRYMCSEELLNQKCASNLSDLHENTILWVQNVQFDKEWL